MCLICGGRLDENGSCSYCDEIKKTKRKLGHYQIDGMEYLTTTEGREILRVTKEQFEKLLEKAEERHIEIRSYERLNLHNNKYFRIFCFEDLEKLEKLKKEIESEQQSLRNSSNIFDEIFGE